jgi:hypothetical protein
MELINEEVSQLLTRLVLIDCRPSVQSVQTSKRLQHACFVRRTLN